MEINNRNVWPILYVICHIMLMFFVFQTDWDEASSSEVVKLILAIFTVAFGVVDLFFSMLFTRACINDNIQFSFTIPNPFKLSESYKQKRINKLKAIENKLAAEEKILELRGTLIDIVDDDVMFERIVAKIEVLELQNIN